MAWLIKRRAAHGQGTVELALMLPILALLIMGVTDFGFVLSIQQRLDRVVHLAVIKYLSTPNLDLATFVANESGLSGVTTSSSFSLGNDGAVRITVTASYDYPLITPGLRNLQTRTITNGTLRLSVTSTGIAATSAPSLAISMTDQATVSAPTDATAPSGVSLICRLYSLGSLVTSGTCPLIVATTKGQSYYATVAQVTGIDSPISSMVTAP